MKEKGRILVVDDNELFRESIVETLRRLDYEIEAAVDGTSACTMMTPGKFDLVISDMKMPGMSGIELLERVKKIDPDLPVLIITAYGAIETAVEAIKKGAYDFIQKSESLIRELEMTVERTLGYRRLVRENRQLKTALRNRWQFIGSGAAMEAVKMLIASVAESRSTVLITGESGTGKELAARSIHFQSRRNNGPFVKVNCAALPEGLIESELFGHEKGAFTGAIKQRKGMFEAASGGTLLLDEISEMPLAAQAKLLRVLQEREVHKVGGEETIEVDVRVIATTNRSLEEEIETGRFREDLYYRLNVIRVNIPPLRERVEDIPELAAFFIHAFNDENGFGVTGIADGCMEPLRHYRWPGNVRELENAVERAVVLTRTGLIQPSMFTLLPSSGRRRNSPETIEAGMTVAEAEKLLIYRTLESCRQNRTKAAEMLGISIRTLRNKLNEYEAGLRDAACGSVE
ncbi:MAG: sigma-54-dependent Fis family transcriptional regulator [Chitinispirillaceae bacterium]|nr:sigma-54-dependent Fis family transcriptional regulator [Chitinispirillaceae bacterium]